MICRPCRLHSISNSSASKGDQLESTVTYEAKTTSRPQGEMEAEPTGLSKVKEPSFPKVGLS